MKLRPKGRKAGRVVRHTLADGTAKEYHYAPHRREPKEQIGADSLHTLIAAFQRSPKWRNLSAATQQNYIHYLKPLHRAAHVRVTEIRRRDLVAVRDQIAASRGDGAAIGFVRSVSALLAWAVENDWLEYNPARGLAKDLAHGHLPAWRPEDAAIAMERLPEPLRRVVVLALYTGQRRGDLCALTWAAYDGRAIRLTQEKTDEPLVIPCHPELKAELDAWRAGPVAALPSAPILTAPGGKPWKPNLLSHYLPPALVRIGLSNELNVHGLRKLAAATLAEVGCTEKEIAAITGHKTLGMVQLYTKSADQQKLAGAAMVRWIGQTGTNKQNR
jgi:integrase